MLLRLQVAHLMGLSLRTALPLGFVTGAFADTMVVVAVASLRELPGKRAGTAVFVVLSLAAWLAALANVLYFRFFGGPLRWWVLRHHLGDLGLFGGSTSHLGISLVTLASAALLVGAASAVIRDGRTVVRVGAAGGPVPAAATHRFAALRARVIPLLLFFAVSQAYIARRWYKEHTGQPGSLLTEQVLGEWLDAWTAKVSFLPSLLREHPSVKVDVPQAVASLVRFRDEGRVPSGPPGALAIPFAPDPARTRALRARLALPAEGPVNLVVVFLESARRFEFAHPVLGPQVQPRMRAAFAQHGISFDQAYASSMDAGQSVRASFTTLCSMMNTVGPAAYISNPSLDVRCLGSLLAEAGWDTQALYCSDDGFHNRALFDRLHGFAGTVDREHFRRLGVSERVGTWGFLADPVLYKEALARLDSHASGPAVFLTIATGASHWPWSDLPGVELPAEASALARRPDASTDYHGYLTGLRYSDEALGDFLDAVFRGPAAARTLVLVLGDHGNDLHPGGALDPVQRSEIRYRVPLAFLTAGLVPEVRTHPIHQLDLAPTLATVLGVGGTVAWLGHDAFDRAGSPWVMHNEGRADYRTADRGCWLTGATYRCYGLKPGADPLDGTPLAEIPEDEPLEDFLFEATSNAAALIELNALLGAPVTP